MKIRNLLLILLFPCVSNAAITMNTVEMGAGLRVEKQTDGRSLDGQGTFSVGSSVAYKPFDLLAEFSLFSDLESTSQLDVQRRHYELLGWLRYTFFSNDNFDVFVGGGLGFYWEKVETSFFNFTETKSSGMQLTGGGTAGFNYKVDAHWALGVDLRLISNTNSELSPVFDGTARVKYLF